jgi:hypothetical protein
MPAWQQWSAREWNDVLFKHFFSHANGPDFPVTRLVVTKDELHQAVTDSDARPPDVEAAFIQAIRCSPPQFKHQVSSQWLNHRGEWNQQTAPGFFVYLVFTCFAASTIAKDVFGVGDFRRRLQILLEHPRDTSYELPELGRLWEALAAWIKWSRARGKPYRTLVLPDPGHMTRIGYTLRLAFPSRRDREALARLVAGRSLAREAPVRTVLRLFADNLWKFTPGFRDAYERFRKAFVAGENGLECYPFWSAVQDAIAAEYVAGTGASRAGKFQLFMQPDVDHPSELFLAARTEVKSKEGIELRPIDGVEAFPFLVAQTDPSRDGIRGAVSLMLHNILHRVVPSFHLSTTQRAVEQGVLLFVRGDSGLRELSVSRPDEHRVWALIREELVGDFLRVLPFSSQPRVSGSAYAEWQEISAFDAAILKHFDQVTTGPLSDVTCLQAVVRAPAVVLSEGIRTDGAYLGFEECFPEVRVRGADSVELVPLAPDGAPLGSGQQPLAPVRGYPGQFRFGKTSGAALQGSFAILGKAAERVVAQRHVTFRTELLWRRFVYPADPSKWFHEAGRVDVASTTFEDDQFTVPVHDLQTGVGGKIGEMGSRPGIRPHSAVDQLTGIGAEDLSPERARDLARLIEVLAAIGSNRQGLGEGDLLGWFERMLGAELQSRIWDVVRAWMEAGYLDARTRATWRGRVYFPREPRLVAVPESNAIRLVLTGLAASDIRTRVHRAAAARGAHPVRGAAASNWVSPLPSWKLLSAASAAPIAAEVGLSLTSPAGLDQVVARLSDVVAEERPEPLNYECLGVWDWARESFRRDGREPADPVRIKWMGRTDRPDLFVVHRDEELVWVTPSRNWALLLAYQLKGVRCFSTGDGPVLTRLVSGQVYLPLPLARWASVSGTAAGPLEVAGRSAGYGYIFASSSDLRQALSALWGVDPPAAPPVDLRWVLEMARRTTSSASYPRVPVPADIRRALLGRPVDEPVRALAGSMIPAFLIPHLRHLLRRSLS